jgi:hypothetical protein
MLWRPWRGYALTSPPPALALLGTHFCTLSQDKKNFYINQEVEALLLKWAIEEVPLFPPPLSYISSIFLVPKKSGEISTPLTSGWRTSATPSCRGIGWHP